MCQPPPAAPLDPERFLATHPMLVPGLVRKYRRLGRAAGADEADLLQSGLRAAVEAARGYRPGPLAPETYAGRLAARAIKREIGRAAARGFAGVGEDKLPGGGRRVRVVPRPGRLPPRLTAPAEAAADAELAGRLAAALGRLAEPHRWAVVLTAAGEPQAAVAARLGLTVRQVWRRREAAVAALRADPDLAAYAPEADG